MEKFVHQQNLVVLRKQLAEDVAATAAFEATGRRRREGSDANRPPQLATSLFWSALQA